MNAKEAMDILGVTQVFTKRERAKGWGRMELVVEYPKKYKYGDKWISEHDLMVLALRRKVGGV